MNTGCQAETVVPPPFRGILSDVWRMSRVKCYCQTEWCAAVWCASIQRHNSGAIAWMSGTLAIQRVSPKTIRRASTSLPSLRR